ncbi:MAG: glycine--tRNA ligase [Candidatus Paceibacterota bacterium]
MNTTDSQARMEAIVSLCKRRGFIFPGSDLYGGLAGTFDYGPTGVLLKRALENAWWDFFVNKRDDMYGLDAAQISSEKIWEASGHLAGFHDPLIEDSVTKKTYRTDHVLEDAGISAAGLTPDQMTALIVEKGIKSKDGNPFSEAKNFNLLFPVRMGASSETSTTGYLRGELAQGMFTNYKNVLDSIHPKLPFGLAQIGKAFRNEIAARDFIFRSREFNLMEFEYFFDPRKGDWAELFEMWRKEMYAWIEYIGIKKEGTHEIEKAGVDLAHYSKRTIDIEFDFPFGQKELYGLAYRTDFDLTQHEKYSGVSQAYVDDQTGEKFIPHVIEPTFGIDRTILAILTSAYDEETVGEGDTRTVFHFSPVIAPFQIAVLPLSKKEELLTPSRELVKSLKKIARVTYDETQSIGKRYRRQDEIGTPYCVTVDFDTLTDNAVTVRDRDTMEQVRIPVAELSAYFEGKLG